MKCANLFFLGGKEGSRGTEWQFNGFVVEIQDDMSMVDWKLLAEFFVKNMGLGYNSIVRLDWKC